MTIYSAANTVPCEGQRVIAHNIAGAPAYSGKTGTVTRAAIGLGVTAEFKSITKPDDTLALSFMEWSYPDESTLTVSEPAPLEFSLGRDGVIVPADAGVQQLRDIIERLSNDLANKKMESEQRQQRYITCLADIDTIGSGLMEEAENRGWCSEYDDFVDNVNASLSVACLPAREKEYEVTWVETYTVSVPRSATYTAKSAEEAEDMAREEDCDTTLIIEAVRDGNWETDYNYAEYEIQEV
jgi:hypothetical protein